MLNAVVLWSLTWHEGRGEGAKQVGIVLKGFVGQREPMPPSPCALQVHDHIINNIVVQKFQPSTGSP